MEENLWNNFVKLKANLNIIYAKVNRNAKQTNKHLQCNIWLCNK